MALSRRHLMRIGQAWIAAAALPRAVYGSEVALNLGQLSRKSFQSVLGSTFTANGTSLTPTWLVLQSIDDVTSSDSSRRVQTALSAAPPATESFILRFSGVGAPLKQGSYEFQNSSLGTIKIFIVPGDRGYSAVFNHLLGPLPANRPVGRN
jgi:hypothetical protein